MDHDLPPAGLELEITESIAMADPESSLATLHALKDMGFGLAIDDFGTGYSSLSYLKQLPLDKLKIDRTFVQHMDTRGDDATIVRSTIHLAHDLGMTVVAEGVESAEHTAMLRDMGCECLQGFYFGRPAPAHTAVAVLPDAHGAVAPRRS
jgi:EAL domain-containing protein (putative c-di-GMP-specific phosphodiesterase class I)